ncbi:UMP kinase [Marispirochaeta sp.]|uniref:UMP kinase n=1 Tax=Marispirochaeta sp. TaxID=2038653 RepID=UPI0029C833E8|nr:UMP kinase [Marispirochaeta sp.]
MVSIISLGGSIVAPDKPDVPFIQRFSALIREYLAEDTARRIILIVGGGGPARVYQQAYREISNASHSQEQDWIGIMATRLNAQLIKGVFADLCPEPVITDPTVVTEMSGRVLVAAGWKPGFSTDTDAVYLAEQFGADRVINLSNIAKVYTDDPKKNPEAEPLETISWEAFQKMVGDEWIPGRNVPFDPVATKKAANLGLTVICAAGRDTENIARLLRGEEFEGTLIG